MGQQNDKGGNTNPIGSSADLLEMNVQQSGTSIADVISQSATKLSQAKEDIGLRDRILNATLDDIATYTERNKNDLKTQLDELFKLLDSVGIQFEGFKKLNAEEQGIIDSAIQLRDQLKRDLELAEQNLTAKNSIPDTWWQRLWGRASKIQAAQTHLQTTKQSLANAETGIDEAKNQAEILFRQRLETSDMEAYMEHVEVLSQKCIQLMAKRLEEINENQDNVEAVLQEGNKTLVLATQAREEAEAKIEEVKATIQQETEVLNGITDNQSDEYAKQAQKLRQLQRVQAEWEGKMFVAESLIKSKESFELKHQQALLAMAGLKNNIKAMQAKLQSDTEARSSFYQAYLMAIKAANDQKLAATLEQTGRKTDEQVSETFAELSVAADKARQDMMEAIPQHNRFLFDVLSSMAEASEESRKRDAKLRELYEKEFGEGTSNLFNGGSGGSSNGDDNTKSEKPVAGSSADLLS